MSEIAIITDTHQGARNGSRVFRDLAREYYRDVLFPELKRRGITTLLHAGDFFDNRNSVTLHDIDYVIQEFIPLLEEHGITMHVIAGNHDVAFRNTNRINSLSILKTSDYVRVIDNEVETIETDGKTFVMCPWVNNENQEALLDTVKHYANDDHILVGHFEIEGALMYKNSKACEHGLDRKMFSKFHEVLSGHFHHRSSYGNIQYLGALFHFNWQDYNDWRGFSIYDTETNEFELIENEYCLFTELPVCDELLDGTLLEDDELEAAVQGQFVRLVANDEYDRVALKDFIAQVEKLQPISVDVIDNTVIDRAVTVEEDTTTAETWAIEDYARSAIEQVATGDKQSSMMGLFDEVYTEAKDRMKEVE